MHKNAIDETGNRYGLLKVLGPAESTGRRGAHWKVRCSCPRKTEFIARADSLRSGNTKSCGCLGSQTFTKDLTGQVFNRWTVLERDSSNHGTDHHAYWWVQCSCKDRAKKSVAGSELRSGSSQSCGCLARELASERFINRPLPDANEVIINAWWLQYTGSARRRKFRWELDKDEFKKLIFSCCHYCGAAPSIKRKSKRGLVLCNGIDRMNNKTGYLKRNVVPCCSRCNIAKADQSKYEFLEWANKVFQHQVAMDAAFDDESAFEGVSSRGKSKSVRRTDRARSVFISK